jgi:hypothetical protein
MSDSVEGGLLPVLQKLCPAIYVNLPGQYEAKKGERRLPSL